MNQYDRYARDSQVLAAIGRVLRASTTTGPVALPRELAMAAVAAWLRDETEEPDTPAETPWQATLRHRAGTLALIGLAIQQRADLSRDPVSIHIDTQLAQQAIAAADPPPR